MRYPTIAELDQAAANDLWAEIAALETTIDRLAAEEDRLWSAGHIPASEAASDQLAAAEMRLHWAIRELQGLGYEEGER